LSKLPFIYFKYADKLWTHMTLFIMTNSAKFSGSNIAQKLSITKMLLGALGAFCGRLWSCAHRPVI